MGIRAQRQRPLGDENAMQRAMLSTVLTLFRWMRCSAVRSARAVLEVESGRSSSGLGAAVGKLRGWRHGLDKLVRQDCAYRGAARTARMGCGRDGTGIHAGRPPPGRLARPPEMPAPPDLPAPCRSEFQESFC
jgi:hypothetical protein